AFMAKLRSIDDKRHRARALEFTILTAARSGETFWATWDEIDFAKKLWTIPKERMKKHREHVVPLSEPAWQVIKEQLDAQGYDEKNPPDRGLIFPGARDGRPMSNTQMLSVLQRLGVA